MNTNESNQAHNGEVDLTISMYGVANGDRAHFKILHDHLRSLVFATAYKVLNDHHDAEEITQEVFTSLWVKAKMYDTRRGSPRTWISTMARNRAIDRLRSKRRRFQLRDELEDEQQSEPSGASQQSVVAQVGLGEEAHILRNAVMRLNDDQRKAIEMTYFSGLSQSQAAEALNTPLGTIKARIRRGVARLRTMVPELSEGRDV
ncbi:MAG: sigma-70 family RNA polymerase sigma factor [Verrucomicrobiota bacterium]